VKIQSSPIWFLLWLVCIGALFGTVGVAFPQSIQLSDSQAGQIGRRLWQNESGGTIAGLTAWNSGEDFASLGIAHFIWYPANKRGPFEESFPPLLESWLQKDSGPGVAQTIGPFVVGSRPVLRSGERSNERTRLLAASIARQARFAALRLERALPKMLEAAPSGDRKRIQENFDRVAGEPQGPYALVDYVNFKGEGVLPSERYRGEGWGLLQVLQEMGKGPATLAFSHAADKVLTRRVANAPVARNEKRWLPGWRNRVRTYAQ
jgi:hypothetical protein